MGLTVHFKFEHAGSEKEVKGKLEEIREKVEKLPVQGIGPLVKLDWKKGNKSEDEQLGWMKIQYARNIRRDDGSWMDVYPEIGYGFTIDIGKGCEPMNIALTRVKGEKVFKGRAFSKDQYAEDFIKCHLLIISVLDICKEEGILKKVEDEGGYWESRDISLLAENINASTAVLEHFSKLLKKMAPPGVEIVSEIDKSKNYVNIKESEKKGGVDE